MSGSIVTFDDAIHFTPIAPIIAEINPIQSGTGDPSPTNVRPISGWTGANIFDASDASRLSAKNAKFDILPVQNGTGTPTPTNVRNIDPGLSFTLDNGTVVDIYRGDITFHVDGTATLISRYANRIFDGSELFTGWLNETRHIATSLSIRDASHEDGTSGYCNRYRILNVGTNLTNIDTYSCAFGSTRSSHIFYAKDERYSTLEEFNAGCVGLQVVYPLYTPVVYELSVAETKRAFDALGMQIKGLSINWQSEAGTIYGGTVTLNEDGSADVVSDMGLDTKSSSDIALRILNSSSSGYNVYRLRMPVEYGDVLISNQYKQYPTVNDAIAAGGGIAIGNKSGSNLYISVVFPWVSGDTNETADARLLANTLQIGYTLATPQTYHFDNIGQLYTFLGTNNIWSSTGDVTVTYIANATKFSFNSPLHKYNFVNLKLFGNTYIEHGKG